MPTLGVRALLDCNGCQPLIPLSQVSQRKRKNINSYKTFISNSKNYKKKYFRVYNYSYSQPRVAREWNYGWNTQLSMD
jgi:hypothetical protein